MRFAEPWWLEWMWGIAPLAVLTGLSVVRRARTLRAFVGPVLIDRMAPGRSGTRSVVRAALMLIGLAALMAGLARPIGSAREHEVTPTGHDVCFVIDVSKSMLAADLVPNRLERAKLWVRDALQVIRGDRVALVAFAGWPSVQTPLTHDYAYFALMLEDLSPRSVPRGGTNLGDAVRKVLGEVFDDEDSAGYRDLILITDGEDLEDSFPVQAAEQAGKAGVRLIIIGIGSEQGTTIVVRDEQGRREVVKDEAGDPVMTHLDASTLRDMARATPGGRFFQVGTGDIRLDEVYETLVAESTQRSFEEESATVHDELFQVFLAIAFAALGLELVLGERRWR